MSVSKFDIVGEIVTFTFKDTNRAVMAGLRNILLSKIVPWTAAVTIKKNESAIKNESLQKSIGLIKFNQLALRPDSTFSLNVTAAEDIVLITTDDIKFSTKSRLCYPNIYLATLEKGKKLVLTGTFEKAAGVCVSGVGTHILSDVRGNYEAIVTVIMLECYDFKTLMDLACEYYINTLTEYSKEFEAGRKYAPVGVHYETNKYSHIVLEAIVQEILIKEPVFVSHSRAHPLTPLMTLEINAKEPAKLIKEAVVRLVSKLKKLRQEFAGIDQKKYGDVIYIPGQL